MTDTSLKDRSQTETGGQLVSSSDVTGTAVYSPSGDHVGDIAQLMIDKSSGRIGYAVMQFGGFFGIGAEEVPVPWGKLHYDTSRGGYVTDITREQIEGLPSREESWARDRKSEERYHSHFGAPYYWL